MTTSAFGSKAVRTALIVTLGTFLTAAWLFLLGVLALRLVEAMF